LPSPFKGEWNKTVLPLKGSVGEGLKYPIFKRLSVGTIVLIKEGRQGISADLYSVEIYQNRIYLGGPAFCGPRMSENILSAFFNEL
jgi:hypothetical protein